VNRQPQPTYGSAAVETFGNAADSLWVVFFLIVLMPVWIMAGALFLVYLLARFLVILTRELRAR
jgi:hypothetical protein